MAGRDGEQNVERRVEPHVGDDCDDEQDRDWQQEASQACWQPQRTQTESARTSAVSTDNIINVGIGVLRDHAATREYVEAALSGLTDIACQTQEQQERERIIRGIVQIQPQLSPGSSTGVAERQRYLEISEQVVQSCAMIPGGAGLLGQLAQDVPEHRQRALAILVGMVNHNWSPASRQQARDVLSGLIGCGQMTAAIGEALATGIAVAQSMESRRLPGAEIVHDSPAQLQRRQVREQTVGSLLQLAEANGADRIVLLETAARSGSNASSLRAVETLVTLASRQPTEASSAAAQAVLLRLSQEHRLRGTIANRLNECVATGISVVPLLAAIATGARQVPGDVPAAMTLLEQSVRRGDSRALELLSRLAQRQELAPVALASLAGLSTGPDNLPAARTLLQIGAQPANARAVHDSLLTLMRNNPFANVTPMLAAFHRGYTDGPSRGPIFDTDQDRQLRADLLLAARTPGASADSALSSLINASVVHESARTAVLELAGDGDAARSRVFQAITRSLGHHATGVSQDLLPLLAAVARGAGANEQLLPISRSLAALATDNPLAIQALAACACGRGGAGNGAHAEGVAMQAAQTLQRLAGANPHLREAIVGHAARMFIQVDHNDGRFLAAAINNIVNGRFEFSPATARLQALTPAVTEQMQRTFLEGLRTNSISLERMDWFMRSFSGTDMRAPLALVLHRAGVSGNDAELHDLSRRLVENYGGGEQGERTARRRIADLITYQQAPAEVRAVLQSTAAPALDATGNLVPAGRGQGLAFHDLRSVLEDMAQGRAPSFLANMGLRLDELQAVLSEQHQAVHEARQAILSGRATSLTSIERFAEAPQSNGTIALDGARHGRYSQNDAHRIINTAVSDLSGTQTRLLGLDAQLANLTNSLRTVALVDTMREHARLVNLGDQRMADVLVVQTATRMPLYAPTDPTGSTGASGAGQAFTPPYLHGQYEAARLRMGQAGALPAVQSVEAALVASDRSAADRQRILRNLETLPAGVRDAVAGYLTLAQGQGERANPAWVELERGRLAAQLLGSPELSDLLGRFRQVSRSAEEAQRLFEALQSGNGTPESDRHLRRLCLQMQRQMEAVSPEQLAMLERIVTALATAASGQNHATTEQINQLRDFLQGVRGTFVATPRQVTSPDLPPRHAGAPDTVTPASRAHDLLAICRRVANGEAAPADVTGEALTTLARVVTTAAAGAAVAMTCGYAAPLVLPLVCYTTGQITQRVCHSFGLTRQDWVGASENWQSQFFRDLLHEYGTQLLFMGAGRIAGAAGEALAPRLGWGRVLSTGGPQATSASQAEVVAAMFGHSLPARTTGLQWLMQGTRRFGREWVNQIGISLGFDAINQASDAVGVAELAGGLTFEMIKSFLSHGLGSVTVRYQGDTAAFVAQLRSRGLEVHERQVRVNHGNQVETVTRYHLRGREGQMVHLEQGPTTPASADSSPNSRAGTGSGNGQHRSSVLSALTVGDVLDATNTDLGTGNHVVLGSRRFTIAHTSADGRDVTLRSPEGRAMSIGREELLLNQTISNGSVLATMGHEPLLQVLAQLPAAALESARQSLSNLPAHLARQILEPALAGGFDQARFDNALSQARALAARTPAEQIASLSESNRQSQGADRLRALATMAAIAHEMPLADRQSVLAHFAELFQSQSWQEHARVGIEGILHDPLLSPSEIARRLEGLGSGRRVSGLDENRSGNGRHEPPPEAASAPRVHADQPLGQQQVSDSILARLRRNLADDYRNSDDPACLTSQRARNLLDAVLHEAERRGVFASAGLTRDCINGISWIADSRSDGAYNFRTNRIQLNLEAENPLAALRHEVQHAVRALERTVLRTADPQAYEARVLDSVLSNVGTGRPMAIPNSTGTGGECVLHCQLSPLMRTRMQQALREAIATGRAPGEVLAQEAYADLCNSGAFRNPFGPGGRESAAQHLGDLIRHYQWVLDCTTIDRTVIASNPALEQRFQQALLHYSLRVRQQSGEQSLYDNPSLVRHTQGLADSVTGRVHAPTYLTRSVEEFSARRAELSQILRSLSQSFREQGVHDPEVRQALLRQALHTVVRGIGEFNANERTVRAEQLPGLSLADGQSPDRSSQQRRLVVGLSRALHEVQRDFTHLEPQPGRTEEGVRSMLDGRCQQLQTALNAWSDAQGVPRLQIVVRHDSYNDISDAYYGLGLGRVVINAQFLNGQGSFLPLFMHEYTHFQQDVLMAWRLADQLRIGHHGSPADIENLTRSYGERTMARPTTEFLHSVLAHRNGRHLDEAASARAQALLIDAGMQRTRAFVAQLADNPQMRSHWFGSEPLPEEVQGLINFHQDIMAGRRLANEWNSHWARDVFDRLLEDRYQELNTALYDIYRARLSEREAWSSEALVPGVLRTPQGRQDTLPNQVVSTGSDTSGRIVARDHALSGPRSEEPVNRQSIADQTFLRLFSELDYASFLNDRTPAFLEGPRARNLMNAFLDEADRRGIFAAAGLTRNSISRFEWMQSFRQNGFFQPSRNAIGISLDATRPFSTLRHEVQHVARCLDRTVLQAADPQAYAARVLDSVLANVGTGRAIAAPNPEQTELVRNYRATLSVPGRQLMQRALREAIETGRTAEQILAQDTYRDLLTERPFYPYSGIQTPERGLPRAAQELAREIRHYNYILDHSVFTRDTLAGNADLQQRFEQGLLHYYLRIREQSSARSLYNEPQLIRLTTGISDNITALVSGRTYFESSLEEFSARRAAASQQLRGLVQQSNHIADPIERLRALRNSSEYGSLMREISEINRHESRVRHRIQLTPIDRTSSVPAERIALPARDGSFVNPNENPAGVRAVTGTRREISEHQGTAFLQRTMERQLVRLGWDRRLARDLSRSLPEADLRAALLGLDNPQQPRAVFFGSPEPYNPSRIGSLDEVSNAATALSVHTPANGYVNIIEGVSGTRLQPRWGQGDNSFHEQSYLLRRDGMNPPEVSYSVPRAEFNEILQTVASEHIIRVHDLASNLDFYMVIPGREVLVGNLVVQELRNRNHPRVND